MSANERSWSAIDITTSQAASIAVEEALTSLDADGIEVDRLRKKDGEVSVVTGYFETVVDHREVTERIRSLVDAFDFSDEPLEIGDWRQVEQQDWLAEWKKHWTATAVGRFIIAPPWQPDQPEDRTVIFIEPNMAFGTGTHATTQLCLAAIDSYFESEMTMLDVGTGTGILAIAAAKIGGREIDAFDTDADSVKIARENAAANDVGWIRFFDGPLTEDTQPADLVCANLTLDVILPILDLLIAKTRSVLIMSGILGEQRDEIEAALAGRSIGDFEVETLGEWLAVTIRQ